MGEILHSAWRNMRRRLSRTLLTVGSIAVGMFMVVVVSFISSTGSSFFEEELESMGMDGLSVRASSGKESLSQSELMLLRSLDVVDTAMPLMIKVGNATIRNKEFSAAVCGIDAGATQAISLELRHGRMFNRGDIRTNARVCIVDETVAKERYGRSNIVGKSIRLWVEGKPKEYRIIGVTVAGSSLLQNLTGYIPDLTFIPYTTLQSEVGERSFDQVAIRFKKGVNTDDGEQTVLRALQRLASRAGTSYQTENLASQKEKLSALMELVTVILTLISGISLVVSGLGIMTIMLVSVGERTREIGIKKALGASPGRIMAEFLAEALVISFGGGLAGLFIGALTAMLAIGLFSVSVSVPVGTLALLLTIEVLIGAVFGVYPARKAAKLEPVEAFRSE